MCGDTFNTPVCVLGLLQHPCLCVWAPSASLCVLGLLQHPCVCGHLQDACVCFGAPSASLCVFLCFGAPSTPLCVCGHLHHPCVKRTLTKADPARPPRAGQVQFWLISPFFPLPAPGRAGGWAVQPAGPHPCPQVKWEDSGTAFISAGFVWRSLQHGLLVALCSFHDLLHFCIPANKDEPVPLPACSSVVSRSWGRHSWDGIWDGI